MGKGKKKAATKRKPLNLDMTFEEAIRRSIQTKIPKKKKMYTKSLFVNQIVDDGRYRIGIAALDKTVIENIRLMYGETVGKKMLHLLTTSDPQGAYLLDRFCQLVVFIQYQPALGFTMKMSDFGGNIDFALDEYIELRENEWSSEDRSKIISLFQNIEANPGGLADMVVVDPIP